MARPMRADARRNRDKLVAAARASLVGEAFSLEAVARQAGVGIGTLYRHFPTKEALVEAVYAVELDALVASAEELLHALPPQEALREWVARYARFTANKRGMVGTLRAGLSEGRIPATTTRERITSALRPILAAGASEGTLRGNVTPEDVTALLLGVFLSTSGTTDMDQTVRLLDLVLDALQPSGSR